MNRPRLSHQAERALLLGLFLLNFAASLWLFDAALTEIPCTGDESSVLFQAQIFAGFRASAPAPENPALFASHYLAVKDGRWFSIYPFVYPLLLAAGLLVLGSAAAAVALMSSAALVLAYLVVRDAYEDRAPAWFVAALLFVSPSFRFYSSSYYTHVGALLAVLSCLRLLQAARPGGDGRIWLGAGLAAALAAGIRPFEAFWLLLPVVVWAAYRLRGLPGRARQRALPAGLLLLAAAVFLAFSGALIGGGLGPYLDVVNSGGRLAVLPNLTREGFVRVWDMAGDAAKWTLAYGYFAAGNLKDVSPRDMNVSFLWLWAGVLWAAWEARRDRSAGGFHRLFLAMLACAVFGHLFYDKQGGPYGERRFFEAIFLFCLFPARLLLLALRRLRPRGAVVALVAVLGVNAACHLLETIARVRLGNADRLQLFLALRRLGVSRGLVYVENCPDFDVSFCLRNRPDLSGNVFVAAGRAEEAVARAFPGRRRYLFRFDWKRHEYVLEPYERAGARSTPRLYTAGSALRVL